MKTSSYTIIENKLFGLPVFVQQSDMNKDVVQLFLSEYGETPVLPNFIAVYFFKGKYIFEHKDSNNGFCVELGFSIEYRNSIEEIESIIVESKN